MRAAAILVLLAGCDIIFRLDDLRAPPNGDGSVSADSEEIPIDAPQGCLQDTFVGVDIQGHWSTINQLQAFTIMQSNALQIDLPMNYPVNAEAGLQTYRRYNFTGAFAQVEVPLVTTSTTYQAENYFTVRVDYQNAYVIRAANARIDFWTWNAGSLASLGNNAYDASAHRWWRIEHVPTGNWIILSTSRDGQTWTERGRVIAALELTRMEISLRAGTLMPGDPAPGRAIYDNFLLCPAAITP